MKTPTVLCVKKQNTIMEYAICTCTAWHGVGTWWLHRVLLYWRCRQVSGSAVQQRHQTMSTGRHHYDLLELFWRTYLVHTSCMEANRVDHWMSIVLQNTHLQYIPGECCPACVDGKKILTVCPPNIPEAYCPEWTGTLAVDHIWISDTYG